MRVISALLLPEHKSDRRLTQSLFVSHDHILRHACSAIDLFKRLGSSISLEVEKMNCPNCQTNNPAEAKFCMSCGTPLANACPKCGTELPADAAFCFNCGHKMGTSVAPAETTQPTPEPTPEPDLDQSQLHRYIPKELLSKMEQAREQGAMAGERRIVTMLFCDVQGSTAAAGQLDPEEWAEIINGAFEHLITPVYRYEGTVARLMGDGMLAFFGAPIAHEDDPQRAVLAGLDILQTIQSYQGAIQEQWGLDLAVRVGINTGLVVVGAVGSDLRVEYTALGDAINLAARMEQTAQAGTVQIAEDTYKLIAPLFDFEDLGPVDVRGKEQPVQAYRVIAPKADPGRLRGIEGLDSPLVGRDGEMHTLRGAIIDLRHGRGQIISIIGEAGLGKSRLTAELRKSPTPIAEAKGALQWIEGRSLSYETTTPYTPFIRLFYDCFGLNQEQSNQEKYERITANIKAILPDRAEELAPFIATLIEIPLQGTARERVDYLDPPQLRASVFQAVEEYLESLATHQPLVVALDDLHWVDPTSLELLEQLLPLTERTMFMILVLFRPRRNEPSWHFHELAQRDFSHRYQAIHIKPLDQHSSRELVTNLLHVDDLTPEVRSLILSKAEGNPFFVEEVIRSLLDAKLIIRKNGHWHTTQEITDIAVPDTLAAVLTTRLDKLDDFTKQVIQTAAVIGRQFQYATLADVDHISQGLEQALTKLQRRELIREKSRLPQRVYSFKHTLTQETAYGSLLLKNRRQLHRLVGASLESREPERVNDIARHFHEAREPIRAFPYFVEAGDRAADAYSTAEAINNYETALKSKDKIDDPALVRRAFEGLGTAFTFANEIPKALETYNAMLDYGNSRGDIPTQVSALNKLSYVNALRLGEFQKAEELMVESERLARDKEDKAGLSELGLIRCMMCTAVADFDGVVRYMDETVAIGREMAENEQMAMGLAHIASSQLWMLQFDESWETMQEGLQLSREIEDREHESDLLVTTKPLLHWRDGDFEAACKSAEEGLAIAERIGSIRNISIGIRMLGYVAHQKGDYERAIDYFERYRQASQKGHFVWFEVEALCLLGSVYLDISPAMEGRIIEFHGRANQLMAQPAGTMMGASAWTELGSCALAINDREKAAEYFEKGLTNPTIPINWERPRLLHGQAQLALAENDLDQASSLLAEAKSIVEEHAIRSLYPLIAFAEAQLHLAHDELDQALEAYRRAEELAIEMGLRPLIWKAQANQSRVLIALGRTAEGEAMHLEAQAMVNEIAGLFEDGELKTMFLENALNYQVQEATS